MTDEEPGREGDVVAYARSTVWLLALINVASLVVLILRVLATRDVSWNAWTEGWPYAAFLVIGPLVGLATQWVWHRVFLPLVGVILGATLAILLVLAGAVSDSPTELVLTAFACAGPAFDVWHLTVLAQAYKALDDAKQQAEVIARHDALLQRVSELEALVKAPRRRSLWGPR